MPVLRAKLDNGLRLVLVPHEGSGKVQVDVRYEVGANQDPDGKAGLAHLVEFLMFRRHNGFSGETVTGGESPKPINAVEHRGRYLTSYTGHETTQFSRSGELKNLRKILREEAVRLYRGCKLIPQSEIEDAKVTIAAKIKAREERPEGKARHELLDAVYPAGHPYRGWVDGDVEQLMSVTHDDICAFTKSYYVPSRVIVVVTGNVGHEELGAMTMEFFGGIPKGEPKALVEVPAIEIASTRLSSSVADVPGKISLVWALPRHFTDEYDYASVMQVAIERIWPRILAQHKNCEPLSMYELGGKIAPVFVVEVSLAKGRSVDQCVENLWEAANRTDEFLPTDQKQQNRSRAFAKLDFVDSMRSMALKGDFAADGVQFDSRVGFTEDDDNYFYDYLDRIDRMDAAGFRAFVAEALRPSKTLIFVAEDGDSGSKTGGEEQ